MRIHSITESMLQSTQRERHRMRLILLETAKITDTDHTYVALLESMRSTATEHATKSKVPDLDFVIYRFCCVHSNFGHRVLLQ